MKQKNYRRIWVVAGVVALSLCLTGCYIPPDEISDGTQDMTVGANSFPFDTVQATTGSPTPTPTVTPTLTPPGSGGVINNPWSTDDWSTTQNPGSSTSQPGGTVPQSDQHPHQQAHRQADRYACAHQPARRRNGL